MNWEIPGSSSRGQPDGEIQEAFQKGTLYTNKYSIKNSWCPPLLAPPTRAQRPESEKKMSQAQGEQRLSTTAVLLGNTLLAGSFVAVFLVIACVVSLLSAPCLRAVIALGRLIGISPHFADEGSVIGAFGTAIGVFWRLGALIITVHVGVCAGSVGVVMVLSTE